MSDSFNNYLANLGDVTVEELPQRDHPPAVAPDGAVSAGGTMDAGDGQTTVNQPEENAAVDVVSDDRRKEEVSPNRSDDMEEMRAEGSADDMELDDTIDSRIGMRMESEGQNVRGVRLDEVDENEDDSMDAVNLLDSLPLEGAPIEGEEVSEAFLLGNDDDADEAEEKSSTRSDEVDEAGKRLGDHDDSLDPAKKKQKKEDGSEATNDPDNDKKIDRKTANMRRNIREVMDETQLDEVTLAAQRQEMERLRRVQEQQRIIREVQRRSINKGTSLLRSNLALGDDQSDEVRLPSSVQLKVNSNLSAGGQVSVTQQSTLAPRRPMAESCRWQKGGRGGFQGSQTSLSRVPGRGSVQPNTQQRVRMMTPSVSISPVVSKKEPAEHLEYYTDSDLSDVDIDYADAEESDLVEQQAMQARKLSGTVQKPGKGKDVVTISSSSESSDDDCIVLSDPSEAEETDNDDDPANSGMHTNDRYNVPDAQGRVLVNVGHPEDEPDVFLAPQIARIIKAHQIGGIRFLYDNIVESIERFKTSTGFGCILAHSMGLGKTLQVACFCDIFFRCTDAKTVLCIMPINTLQNWLAEFNMWLPYEDPNKSKIEEKANIKEESNQSDLGYMSRQSSEHDSSSQHPPGSTMTPEAPLYPPPHPSYNQGYNPYAPPGNMYDPRYGAPYPGYKPEPYGMPQYNYPPPTAPTYQDPHAPYPGYGVPYPGYGVQPPVPPRPEAPPEVKKENPPGPPPAENPVKTEPVKEEPKKESSEETKKDDKDPVTVKTPFSVDAPSEMEVRPRHFALHILNDSHKTMAARARVIREWQKVGGVLLIGYELYRQLSLKKPNKAKKKRGQPFKDPTIDDDDNNKNKPLLDEMHTALVNPGPDLVICDEGHRIKNSHASISLALKQMRTKRRIVLTGYPLQNNLLEYWCMVDFVRPNYLGTKSEFCNMFERPIQNGQCIDSTPQDIRLMRYRAHVLHSLLEGFVQRRSHAVLQVSLPRKEEYILLVRLTPHQRKLYDTFMNQVVKTRAVPNPLKAFAVCCKIWNHPDVLYHFLKKRQANEEDDLDLEERDETDKSAAGGVKRTPKPRAPKGEGKKGKKGSPKNKPAASVQPNSSTMSMENGEGGEPKQGFQNFNAPQPPPAQGSTFPQQNNYQQSQQQGGYQNYQGGEYNNYYGNQNQQSQYPTPNNQSQQTQPPSFPATGTQSQPSQPAYPPTGTQSQKTQPPYPPTSTQIPQNQQQPYPPTNNTTQQSYPQTTGTQSFPPYAQNSNYPPTTQPSQPNYQAPPPPPQQQNYNERFPGPSPTGPSPSPSAQNYRPEPSQPTMTAPGSAGNFPRPNYPYQGSEGANYQGQNYSQTAGYQIQQSNSYGSYPPPASQGYSGTSGQNYAANSQQPPPSQQQQQAQGTTGYQPQQQQSGQTSTGYQQQPQPQPAQGTTGYQQQQQQPPSNPPTPSYPPNQQAAALYSQPPSGQSNQQYSSSSAQQQPYTNTATQPYANSTTQPTSNQQYSSTNAPPNQSYSSSTPQLHQPYANNTTQACQPQSASTPNQPHSYSGTPTANATNASVPYNSNQTQQQQQAYQGKGLKGGSYPNQTSTYQHGQEQSNTVQQSQFDYSNKQQQQPPYQQQPTQQQQPQSQQYQQPPVQQSQSYQQPPVQQSGQYQQPSGQKQQSQSQPQQYQQPPAQPAQQQSQSQQYQQPPAQSQQQYQQQGQSHGYNQTNPAYQPTTQQAQPTPQQSSVGYQQNQASSTNSSAQTYGYQSQPNQPVQNYQQPAQTIKTEPGYGYHQTGNNYSSTTNSDTPIPGATQTPSNQQPPPAQGQNQYWQGNYQNSTDPYYNQNSNQYQANYQGNATGNYQANQQPQQQQSQYQNYPNDGKAPQQNQSSGNPTQPVPSNSGAPYNNSGPVPNSTEPLKDDEKAKIDQEKDKLLDKDKDKEDKSDDELMLKDDTDKGKCSPTMAINVFKDQEPGIPYDWATELMKGYVPGLIDASAKMTIFFCILEEAIRLGDRVLTFSQSLFTLNLIEDFLARNDFKYADGKTESWGKNTNYFRLDGSTSALERERLINEFNANPKIHLFLVSTRAGSLGINLVGANRAIVFDASWNPCHDTQAVCRVYRYGQKKNCYVYRLVTDNCLERKIYDRQISKQGMSDRVVDQCNPDAHLSLKEATTLNWDWEEDSDPQDFSEAKDKFPDDVMHIVLEKHSTLLTKQPFHHESLLVDRKDKKLSQAEKRLARRGYELEKMAATSSKPSYNYVPGNTAARVAVQSGSIQIRQIRDGPTPKPVASVRPMQQRGAEGLSRNPGGSKWIPAEVWQRQGMSAQEMTLPLDVVIPTNSPDKGSIVLKAGQRVMVLKSPKGIYMQLESGKIIAIRTALKVGGKKEEEPAKKTGIAPVPQRNNTNKGEVSFPLRNNSAISIIPKSSTSNAPIQPTRQPINMRPGVNYRPFGEKEVVNRRKTGVATAAAKPYNSQFNSHQVSVSRINNKSKPDYMGDNSNSSDGHKVRPEQRVEEVRIEDVVSEKGSNSEYSPASSRLSSSDTDTNLSRPMMDNKRNFPLERSHNMHIPPYAVEPKINVPRKLQDMNRQKDRKSDSSDDVIIEDPSKRLHQPYQPYQQQPTRPQPRPAAPRAETGKPTPTMPSASKPTPDMESQPLTGYPYAQYPRYYDYTDPRTRPLADPYGSYFPPTAPSKPSEDKPKSSTEAATGFTRPTKETTQPVKPTDTTLAASSAAPAREDPHGPTAFSHPSSVRPAYPPGPYPPYDPYAQHYPSPAGSAAYSAGAAAAAATYPAYGTPSYNADYARMYPAFPAPPPTAADPYRSYGPPPPPSTAAGPPSNYYAPFPHPPPPPYPNYSFLPPYPNPGVPAEPQPPAP